MNETHKTHQDFVANAAKRFGYPKLIRCIREKDADTLQRYNVALYFAGVESRAIRWRDFFAWAQYELLRPAHDEAFNYVAPSARKAFKNPAFISEEPVF